MPKMIIIECSDEEADRMVEQLKNMIAEYEYHPYHGPGKVYEFGSLRIDQPKQEVTLNGVMVDLTRREFEILGLLAEHPNQALPADFLHNAVWSHPNADHGEEEVAAYINRSVSYTHLVALHGKAGPGGSPDFLSLFLLGVGYGKPG